MTTDPRASAPCQCYAYQPIDGPFEPMPAMVIRYCTTHAAAPAMAEALRKVLALIDQPTLTAAEVREAAFIARAALPKP